MEIPQRSELVLQHAEHRHWQIKDLLEPIHDLIVVKLQAGVTWPGATIYRSLVLLDEAAQTQLISSFAVKGWELRYVQDRYGCSVYLA